MHCNKFNYSLTSVNYWLKLAASQHINTTLSYSTCVMVYVFYLSSSINILKLVGQTLHAQQYWYTIDSHKCRTIGVRKTVLINAVSINAVSIQCERIPTVLYVFFITLHLLIFYNSCSTVSAQARLIYNRFSQLPYYWGKKQVSLNAVPIQTVCVFVWQCSGYCNSI